jgi:hypothetical protein
MHCTGVRNATDITMPSAPLRRELKKPKNKPSHQTFKRLASIRQAMLLERRLEMA